MELLSALTHRMKTPLRRVMSLTIERSEQEGRCLPAIKLSAVGCGVFRQELALPLRPRSYGDVRTIGRNVTVKWTRSAGESFARNYYLNFGLALGAVLGGETISIKCFRRVCFHSSENCSGGADTLSPSLSKVTFCQYFALINAKVYTRHVI